MRFTNPVGWVVCAAALCHASPVSSAALVAGPIPKLAKRTFSSCDLTKKWKDELLFHGSHADEKGGEASLSVTCADCYTKGSITASLSSDSMVNPKVRLDLSSVEAYVDLALACSSSSMYTIPLYKSTGLSVGIEGLFDIGVNVNLDLVFSMSKEVEIAHGGFYLKVAEGAFIETSLLEGVITGSNFAGLGAKSLPVELVSGDATFQANLRLRTECGAEGSLAGIGAGAELGIYANLIEFHSTLEGTSESECGCRATESWDMNVGAYGHANMHVDHDHYSAVPTVSTTLMSMPKSTQCWKSRSHTGHGSHSTKTKPTWTKPTWTKTKGHHTKTKTTESVATKTTVFTSVFSTTAFFNQTNTVTNFITNTASTADVTTVTSTEVSVATSVVTSTAVVSTVVSETATAVVTSVAEETSVAGETSTAFETSVADETSTAVVTSVANETSTAVVTSVAGETSTADVTSVAGEASTSTVFSTTVFTITSCAASVVNCPASYASAITVTATVPVTETQTETQVQTQTQVQTATQTATVVSSAAAVSSAATVSVTVTDIIVMTPCPTPVVATFTPPPAVETTAAGASGNAGASGAAGASDTAVTVAPVAPTATDATAAVAATGGATTIATTFTWANGTVSTATKVAPSGGKGTAAATTPGAAVVTAGAAPVAAGGSVALLAGALAGMLLL